MPTKALFTYTPSRRVKKGPNVGDDPIVILPTNVAYNSDIPKNMKNKGFESVVQFLSNCRLRYALADVPDVFYPKQVCEFYYTCRYDENTKSIIGTIANSNHIVRITPDIIRSTLRLPVCKEYSPMPDNKQCKTVISTIGYNEDLEGKRNNIILRQCLSPGWKYITGVIGKCLCYKNSSHDQLNLYELKLFYSIYLNKRIDYAQLFFDQITEFVCANKRPSYVPFPRWLSLILQYQSRGYKVNSGDEMDFPKMSTKNIKVAIRKDDVPMTRRMISWINQPYTADRPQLPEDDLEDDDEGIGNEGNDDNDVDDDDDDNDDDDDVDDDTNQNNDNDNDDDDDDDDDDDNDDDDDDDDDDVDVDAHANQNNINENDDDDDDDSENDDDAIKNNDVVQMDNSVSHDGEYERGFDSLSYHNNIPRVCTHIYFNSSEENESESDKLESPHDNEIDNYKLPPQTEPVILQSPPHIASPIYNSRPSSPHMESPTHATPSHVLTGQAEGKQSKLDSVFQDLVISSLKSIESRMVVIESDVKRLLSIHAVTQTDSIFQEPPTQNHPISPLPENQTTKETDTQHHNTIDESDKGNNTDIPISFVAEVANECNEDDNGDEHVHDIQVHLFIACFL